MSLDLLNSIGLWSLSTVVTAIVSTVVANEYPLFFEYYFPRSRLPVDLCGNWNSAWQTNENKDEWTPDQVTIKNSFSGLIFANSGNDDDYQFVGSGRYLAPNFIYGTYKSLTVPKSDGVFILLYEKGFLVGFFGGPKRNGQANYGAWILTKRIDKEDAATKKNKEDDAKKKLREHGPSLQEIFCKPRKPLIAK